MLKRRMNYQQHGGGEEVEVVPNAWSSELPADLLGMITHTLLSLSLSQFIRFGCVCLEWRSFSIENYQHIKLPNKLPVLLIPIPPSLTLTDHQKRIPSPPPSPSSSSEEEEVEEEEEEKEEEEEEKEEDKGEDKEAGEKEKDKEKNTEEEEEEVEEEEEEEEEEEVVREECKMENYYNPKEIWQGQDTKQRHKSTRTFYSLSEKRVYHDFQLPVPYYKNIVGSSHGWLVTVEECWGDKGKVYLPVRLLNPFRTDNNEIKLPPITDGKPGDIDMGDIIYDSYFLKKAYLSANPSSLSDPSTQLVVLGVYGCNRLAFCRPGDKAWTRLDLEEYRPIQDIICYKGQFYAILQCGYVFAFVFNTAQLLPTPIVTLEFSPPKEDVYPWMGTPIRYLVESGGDLLQVRRDIGCLTPSGWVLNVRGDICLTPESLSGRPTPREDSGYITSQFLVFKLDPMGEWVRLKTLNDPMLFIGTSSSMSLSASDFPGWSRPNSIYYTDDNIVGFATRPQNGPHDIGIFNLEDESFEQLYEAETKTIMPPPIWIQPML